jgi:hypothetical protein
MNKFKTIGFAVLATVCCSAANAEFKVGFGSIDVTPPLGIDISGYSHRRIADGILDPLEALAVAFCDGTNRAVVISADLINVRAYFDLYRKAIAEETGLDPQAVFIACTHTHTGPIVGSSTYGDKFDTFEKANTYELSLKDRFASVAKLALADLSPATLAIARGEAKGISFIRRYRMKDGTCHTNPGVGNPDIVGPIGEADEQVQLVRVDRPGKPSIAIVNFQCHPDTIGGNKISADWPRVVRETVEKVLDDVKCICINGAQGDSNHICVDRSHPAAKVPRKKVYIHMGRVVAGEAIGLWDQCESVEPGKVGYGIATAKVKTNRGRPEELAEAKRIRDLVRAKRFKEIPGEGMMKTTIMANARRIEHLANGPDYFELPLSAVTVGNALAFTGFPGEPFTEYGVLVKKHSPFAMTIPACVVNGNFGYLPTAAAFKETGYETQGSFFTAGLESAMVDGHVEQLKRLAEKKPCCAH